MKGYAVHQQAWLPSSARFQWRLYLSVGEVTRLTAHTLDAALRMHSKVL